MFRLRLYLGQFSSFVMISKIFKPLALANQHCKISKTVISTGFYYTLLNGIRFFAKDCNSYGVSHAPPVIVFHFLKVGTYKCPSKKVTKWRVDSKSGSPYRAKISFHQKPTTHYKAGWIQ